MLFRSQARHNVVQAQTILHQGHRTDFALLLPGGTDLQRWLNRKEYEKLDPSQERKAFASYVRCWKKIPGRRADTLLDQYRKKTKERVKQGLASLFAKNAPEQRHVPKGRYLEVPQRHSIPADRIPMFDAAIDDFAANLRDFVRACKVENVLPILVTHPMMYEEGIGEEHLQHYVWRSRGNPDEWAPTPRLYHDIMGAYADAVKKVAREEMIPCIDLYSMMYGRLDCFIDQAHFNEKGARVVADILAGQLAPLLDEKFPRRRYTDAQ